MYCFYIGACNLCLVISLYGSRCIRCSGMVDDLTHLSPLCSVRDPLIQDEMLLGLKLCSLISLLPARIMICVWLYPMVYP